MKKFFIVSGIIIFVLAIGYLTLISYGNRLDASSKTFVDTNMAGFFSTFSKDALVKASTVTVQDDLNNGKLDHLLLKLNSRLGQFRKYEGSKGEASINFNYNKIKINITADYVASASYQNGTVQAEVRLIKVSDQWQINDINITSPIFGE